MPPQRGRGMHAGVFNARRPMAIACGAAETGFGAFPVAISPPSDIVLDVARAAEPQTLEAARARLAARTAATGTFRVGEAETARNTAAVLSTRSQAEPRVAAAPGPFEKFEAGILQSFIQSMLPNQSGSVYGKGLSGDMWKSMMAEQIAGQIAANGRIGIASRLLADRYVDGETVKSIGAVSDTEKDAAIGRRKGLSDALLRELQRRVIDGMLDTGTTKSGT